MSKNANDPPIGNPRSESSTETHKILLRSETLEITEKRILECDVKVHKERLTEQKTITVPVTREELVIEKIDRIEGEPRPIETLRIPLREERVDVIKTPVFLEYVSVQKRHFQENEHVEAVLKKEHLHVDVDGECIVVDNESAGMSQTAIHPPASISSKRSWRSLKPGVKTTKISGLRWARAMSISAISP